MARTNTTKKTIRAPWDKTKNTALYTKFAEHDTALDALEAYAYGTKDAKESCRCATTADHALSGLTAIDGVTPVAGNRVLARAQSTGSQNGIYVAASGAWSRATDADASAEVTAGMRVYVSEGTVYGDTWHTLTTDDPITLGSTSLTFTKDPTLAELASTAASKGAALIGSNDAGSYYTATNVETILQEIYARLIATDATGYASVQGVRDVGTYYTATTLEGVLQEIYARLIATDATGYASVQGIRDVATIYTATTVEGALAEVKALADAAIALAKKEQRIQHTDLTNAVNGATQAINIGTALPANAVVLAAQVNIATLFSGGGASAVKLDVGGTDIDAIGAQHDVFTGAATGALTLTPAGVHTRGKFSSEQLVATFTPDGGHNLDGLTAGDLTVTVWYSILA